MYDWARGVVLPRLVEVVNDRCIQAQEFEDKVLEFLDFDLSDAFSNVPVHDEEKRFPLRLHRRQVHHVRLAGLRI